MPAGSGHCPTRPSTPATRARTRSATWPRTSAACDLPVLGSLGLGSILPLEGVPPAVHPAIHGRLHPLGPGKESTTGHWELMGVVPTAPLPTYPDGFPPDVVAKLEERTGLRFCANHPASGTEVIEEWGEHHLSTGEVILYTSADSVLQLAAHHDVLSEPDLLAACAAAREVMTGEHAVGRVIARPFVGEPGSFAPHRRAQGLRGASARPLLSRGAAERRGARPRRRQGSRPLRRRGHRRVPPRRHERARHRRDRRAPARARRGAGLRQPRGDRPGLRPSPRRRGLPPRAARDRRRRRRVARPPARRGPARAHRRPRRGPARTAHRPHARARAAAGHLPRSGRPPPRRPAGRRGGLDAEVAGGAARPRSFRARPSSEHPRRAVRCLRCQSFPRSRRSAASSRPSSRGASSSAWTSPTLAGACRWRPRRSSTPSRAGASSALRRRGKYLVWELEDEAFLLMHLRMTGTLLYDAPPGTALRARALGPRRRPRAALLRPAALRDRRAGARDAGARRLLRRPPRARAARRRAHRRGAAAHGPRAPRAGQGLPARPAAHRGRREHLRRRGALPGAASIRCARSAASPARSATRSRTRCARRLRPASRRAARRSTTSATSTASGAPSRTSSSCTAAGASRARAAAAPVVKFVAAGRGTYVCESCQPRPRRRRARRPAR